MFTADVGQIWRRGCGASPTSTECDGQTAVLAHRLRGEGRPAVWKDLNLRTCLRQSIAPRDTVGSEVHRWRDRRNWASIPTRPVQHECAADQRCRRAAKLHGGIRTSASSASDPAGRCTSADGSSGSRPGRGVLPVKLRPPKVAGTAAPSSALPQEAFTTCDARCVPPQRMSASAGGGRTQKTQGAPATATNFAILQAGTQRASASNGLVKKGFRRIPLKQLEAKVESLVRAGTAASGGASSGWISLLR